MAKAEEGVIAMGRGLSGDSGWGGGVVKAVLYLHPIGHCDTQCLPAHMAPWTSESEGGVGEVR